MKRDRNRVCPVELADGLDSKVRRWLQNPRRILRPYVKEGMTVLDLGCGPGFFSVEAAKLVGGSGRVFSADLQEGMLQKLADKIRGTDLETRIQLVKCDEDNINVHEKMDFMLAFYMVHEVPDKNSLFRQLKGILEDRGQFLLVEPKLFHVSRAGFAATMALARDNGFRVDEGPQVPFSWTALCMHA